MTLRDEIRELEVDVSHMEDSLTIREAMMEVCETSSQKKLVAIEKALDEKQNDPSLTENQRELLFQLQAEVQQQYEKFEELNSVPPEVSACVG